MPEPVSGGPTGQEPIPEAFRAAIGEVLADFVDRQQRLLAPLGPDLDPMFAAARVAVAGGKRLRAAFVYWGWRAAGGSASKTESLLRCAAAVELVHASALVHDDVIDASATRRGQPSAHRSFAALRRPERATDAAMGTADRFGRSAAILLGDMLLAWSDELFIHSGFKPKAVLRGRTSFDTLRREVVAGQYLDVLAQTRRHSSASNAMRVLLYKSAKYTVERPLQLGASLGEGDETLLRSLSSYGVPVGEAFQLRDDLLGVFGESSETGKPSGDDIREGKRTLLVARAFDQADADQRTLLDSALGNPDLDDAAIAAVQRVLVETGAVTAVETVISELTSAAIAGLRQAPITDPEARAALHTLSDQATNRTA